MAYKTGNPIGSSDPRDLYDNAEILDQLVNSNEKLTHPDRLGVQRQTWRGMEQRFAELLANSGYQFVGDYQAGIEITEYNQVVRDAGGELWRLSARVDTPYTTTGMGMPEDDAFIAVGDAALRNELAEAGGSIVKVKTATGLESLNKALDRRTITVESISELKGVSIAALSTHQSAIVATTNRKGIFLWTAGDMSSSVGGDPAQGVWVAPSDDTSGASGAWRRQFSSYLGVDVGWFGAVLDGVVDDAGAFQAALDYCAPNGIKTFWSGIAKISTTLQLKSGNSLSSSISTVWDLEQGDVLLSGINDGSPVVKMAGRSSSANGFTIQGNHECIGIEADAEVYDISWRKIKVKECSTGFKTNRSWNIDAQYLRTENCETGFSLTEGTSSNWVGCLAYGGELGWKIGLVTYNVFSGCGSDNASKGFLVQGARGVTFNSPGLERLTDYGFRVENNNTDIVINSPAFLDHSSRAPTFFHFVAGSVTVNGCRIPSAFSPIPPGQSITHDGGDVTFVNPRIFGEIGDIDRVTVVGGRLNARAMSGVKADQFSTWQGETQTLTAQGGESVDLATLRSGVYLATAAATSTGTQRVTSIISVSGGSNTVTITAIDSTGAAFINSGVSVRLVNNSDFDLSYYWGITKLS